MKLLGIQSVSEINRNCLVKLTVPKMWIVLNKLIEHILIHKANFYFSFKMSILNIPYDTSHYDRVSLY